ncbi:hypothetical protein BKA62DRAFT_720568 [Auriculariales sp. MPI-PUGE-AT-0066]|nr:hypothetical protein BKA62DRAFT_720568 [Auriculariales sp. MPI-PUGE-AT-0066]
MSMLIAGRQVPKYFISLGTYLSVGGISYLAMSGGDKKKKTDAPASGANRVDFPSSSSGNSEEADFIKNFMAEAEKSDAKH